jgi:hypothetical protein
MEKSFNDDELADIMNEIENLEKEYADQAAEESSASHEVEAEEHEPAEPAILRPLANKPLEETVLKTNRDEKVVPLKAASPVAPAAGHHSSLSFKVEGQMSLSLSFEVNGQSVYLTISDDGLDIEMETGAKFTLPMSSKAHRKSA